MDESPSSLFWSKIEAVGGRSEVDELVELIVQNPELAKDLMNALNQSGTRQMKGAAWVLSHLGENIPGLVQPFLESLLDRVEENPPEPVRRAIFRYFQFAELPEQHQARLWELGIQTLQSNTCGTAPRVFALQMLFRICQYHPDLGIELRTILAALLPEASPGLASRSRKILKQLAHFEE